MPKIAVIEDDQAISQMYRFKFEAEGFTVQTADNGKLGLELVEKMKPDIILLDLMMPEMTGDVVFEQIRRVNPEARVILLTGCDDKVARRMFEAGLSGYIQKPFYIDDLAQRVQEELSQA